MDKFDYAYIDNGIDAWTNSGRLHSAQSEFSRRIQGQPVSKKGIENALIGLTVWENGWGSGKREVTRVEIVDFFELKGLATVRLFNDGSMKTGAKVHWNPNEVVKAKPKASHSEAGYKALEERVANLEKLVAKLMANNM